MRSYIHTYNLTYVHLNVYVCTYVQSMYLKCNNTSAIIANSITASTQSTSALTASAITVTAIIFSAITATAITATAISHNCHLYNRVKPKCILQKAILSMLFS